MRLETRQYQASKPSSVYIIDSFNPFHIFIVSTIREREGWHHHPHINLYPHHVLLLCKIGELYPIRQSITSNDGRRKKNLLRLRLCTHICEYRIYIMV